MFPFFCLAFTHIKVFTLGNTLFSALTTYAVAMRTGLAISTATTFA